MFLGELYEPQKSGANFLCQKKKAILAYEQGTGKTIIAIAAAEKLIELDEISKILVVSPSAITWQWADKVREFSTAPLHLVSGPPSKRRYDGGAGYTITSYALFRRDFETIQHSSFDLVICDEAQEFKNNRTKTARLLKEFNRIINPEYRWALTGTVISNKLEELFSIMFWVDKEFLPVWPEFEKRHIVRHPYTSQIVRYKGLEELAPYLEKRLNRKTHADMAGQMPELLPARIIYIDKHKELRDAEKELVKELDRMAEEIQISEDGQIKGARPDAKVASAFHLVRSELASPHKLNELVKHCKDILDESRDNRIVCFSFYKLPLAHLQEILEDSGIKTYFFTGNETSEAKQVSIRNFKAQSSVLLCSNAGSAGLDLPFANYLFHIDVPFSWGVLDQRSKRIVRAGSKWKSVVVTFLVIKDSLEEYYYRVVLNKGKLADAVYTGNTDTVTLKTQSLRAFIHDRDKPRQKISRVRKSESDERKS